MAVYTEVTDEALAGLLKAYDLGRLLSFKGIAEGVENTNYLLATERGRFIVTLYERRVDPDDLPFFLNLMDHLAGRDVPCPVPVKTKAGETLVELEGRPCALVTFLNGLWIKRPRAEHCAELGAAMAKMHLAGADFNMTRANSLSVADWRPLLEANSRADVDRVAPGLYDELDDELDALAEQWPEGLPSGVIHADLFPDNVFFLDDRLSGLIDFYFACTDAFAFDLAICLNAWCFEQDISFNITKARALLAAYAQIRAYEQNEFEAMSVLARGAAMRFLLTRLYDWVNTPKDALVTPKDPREYLKILRFHRGVSSSLAYGIDPATTP